MSVNRNCFAVVAASLAMIGSAGLAQADIINISGDTGNSTEGIGDFTGTLQYDFLGGTLGLLTVNLTNTSVFGNGGFITAFIFNIGTADGSATATLATADYDFDNAPGQSGEPFGDPYLAGAGINGSFLGGGNPNAGIAFGETGEFTFDIVASDASALTASSFLDGPYDFNFLVRFRGYEPDGSDKVPAVPAPASLALLGAGILAAGSRGRRG